MVAKVSFKIILTYIFLTNLLQAKERMIPINQARSFVNDVVKNMSYLFQGASAFNEPIGSWDVSKVRLSIYKFLWFNTIKCHTGFQFKSAQVFLYY